MKLTTTEINIYEYCKENSEHISSLKIEELAEVTFTTASTISKLVKKLGLKNFFEFKNFFKLHYSFTKDLDDMDSFLTSYLNCIMKSLVSIDFNSVDNLASSFSLDKAIILYGAGSSGYACKYFADNLVRLGYNCIYDPEYFICATRAKLFEDSLIICITNSGETENIISFVQEVDSKEINYITSNEKFLFTNNSIVYTENTIQNSIFSNHSLLLQIAIIDHILHELSKKQNSHATTKFNSIYN